MKILYVCFEFPPEIGGGSTYNKILVDSLSKNAADVVVFTSGDKDTVEGKDNLIIVRSINARNIYKNNGNYLKIVDDLIEVIKNYKPDIIQTQQYIETIVTQVANKSFSLPMVVTHHKTPEYKKDIFTRNSKWSYFDYVNNDFVEHFISPSDTFVESLLQSLGGVDLNKITRIYPGVSTCFKKVISQNELDQIRRKIGIGEGDKVILLPLKIRKRKGLNFMLDSLKVFFKENQTANVRVLITSTNNDSYSESVINEYKKELGGNFLEHNFSFTEEEMVLLYNIASVSILPSQSEGLGLSLIEAMSSGCPVVGTNVQGIYEIIDNNINGLLVEYGNKKAMSNAICELLNDNSKRTIFIQNAYKKVEEFFGRKIQAEKHLKVYSEVINSRKISCGGVLFRYEDKSSPEIFLCIHDLDGHVFPKGGIKKGETLVECASREIMEETGYLVTNPKYSLGSLSYKFNMGNSGFKKVVHLFAYEITTEEKGQLSLEENEKISGGEWYDLDTAISLVSHENEKDKLIYLKKILLKNYDK